jgi:hypothetical protein
MDLQEEFKKLWKHQKSDHQDASAHHNERAAGHTAMLGQHKEGEPAHEFHKCAAESHLRERDSHDQKAGKCDKAIANCDKADSAGDLAKSFGNPAIKSHIEKMVAEAIGKTVQPTRISAVAPPAPAGLVAVPRIGQRAIPEADAAPVVPIGFEKLFATEDTEPSRQ